MEPSGARSSMPVYYISLDDASATSSLSSWVDGSSELPAAPGGTCTSEDGNVVAMLGSMLPSEFAAWPADSPGALNSPLADGPPGSPHRDSPLRTSECLAAAVSARRGRSWDLRDRALGISGRSLSLDVPSRRAEWGCRPSLLGRRPLSPRHTELPASPRETRIPSAIRQMHLHKVGGGACVLSTLKELCLDSSASGSECLTTQLPVQQKSEHNPHVAYSMELHRLKVR